VCSVVRITPRDNENAVDYHGRMERREDDVAKPAEDEAPDGIQWKTVGPALAMLTASSVLAFVLLDPSLPAGERAGLAAVTALAQVVVAMLVGGRIFFMAGHNPSRTMVFGVWAVTVAMWWFVVLVVVR